MSKVQTILLIEDNPPDIELISEMLSSAGSAYSLKTASRLSSGLEILMRETVDIVLLDLWLPDSNGLETFQTFQKSMPGVAVIVLTRYADEKLAIESISAGAQDYLTKEKISSEILFRSIAYSIERKHAAQALRASEERFALFMLHLSAAAWIKDLEGRYVYANTAAERIFNISLRALLGKTDFDIFPETTARQFVENDQRVLAEGGHIETTEVLHLPDGVDHYSMVSRFSVPGRNGKTAYVAGVAFNVTEMKHVEAALRESEERLRLAAEGAGFGTYDICIETGDLFWSQELKILFGVHLDAPSKIPWTEGLKFIYPEDRARVLKVLSKSMDAQSNGKFREEHRVIRTDGSVIWVSMRGETFFEGEGEKRHPIRVAGMLMDITKHRHAEEELKKSEERYRALVHTTSSTVWRVSADGRKLLELSGTVPDEYRLKKIGAIDWRNLIHPDDRKRTHEKWKSALESKSPYEVEHRSLHADGTYHYLLSRAVPITDSSGQVVEWIGSSIDITERKRTEQALLESEARFRTLADNISQLAWMADTRGNIFWFNKRWYDYTGSAPEEMKEGGWQKLIHSEHLGRVLDSMGLSFEKGEPWEDTFPVRGRDGVYRWFLSRAIPIRNENGLVKRWFGTKTDIAERMRMEEEIRQMAHHDLLTGLPNRRLFNEIIAVEIAQSRRNGKKLAIFFLDLDRFKEINDTLGHETGDELLRQVAERLTSAMRVSDTIARIGGDEFNIIVPDIDYPEYAAEVAGKILNEIRRPFTVNRRELNVSTSIGISIFPQDSEEIEALLRYADMAMYDAKGRGRNKYQFYNPVINIRSMERFQFEERLRYAIEHDEFRLFCQPLVDLRTGKITSVETLLRWQHPQRGFLAPYQFLQDAKNTGFSSLIDEWVLKHAAEFVRGLNERGILLPVTVNISSGEFQRSDLKAAVSSILEESELPDECFQIEIEESVATENVENTIARTAELSRIGVSLSLDHFGTGYSSLDRLRKLPVEKLKIDKALIAEIEGNDGAFVKALIGLAHAMNCRIVAEGVETEKQLLFLRDQGCDEAQGFLFREPVPIEQFAELITCRDVGDESRWGTKCTIVE